MSTVAGLVIRPIRPEEHGRLAEITVAAYREAGETDEPYYAELADVGTRAASVDVLVAVDPTSGAVLGGLTYVGDPMSPYAEGEFGEAATFRHLAVDEAARGRGVGRALVAAAIERARAGGRPSVGIFTRPFMTAAQALYESLGFERDPALDWQFAPGEWLFAYRLQL
jgi:ribosomal protein S18 acetylase RimI-like enzyme